MKAAASVFPGRLSNAASAQAQGPTTGCLVVRRPPGRKLQLSTRTDQEAAMTWVGTWRNQYGSVLEITGDADGRIEGSFRTALTGSALHGQQPAVVGVHHGDLIGFTVGGAGPHGRIVVGYTGLLRDGRLETLWHMAAGETLTADAEGAPARREALGWWRAVTTGADTFERVA